MHECAQWFSPALDLAAHMQAAGQHMFLVEGDCRAKGQTCVLIDDSPALVGIPYLHEALIAYCVVARVIDVS